MERGFALVLVCVFFVAPAGARNGNPSFGQSPGEGEVYVYFQPPPLESGRLAFSIASASAVNDLGSEVPLNLSFSTVKQPEARRQRLLASGRLAVGSYAGLSIKVQKASRRQESGEATLSVPDNAVRVDAPFAVSEGRALVLWLSLGDAAPGSGSGAFDPTFSASVAPRPMVSRSGFVSNARSNSVTVFDRRLRQAAAVVSTCGGPSGMALDQRAGRLYVACRRDDEIQVIDVASAEIVERARLTPGDGPLELALTPDGRTLLVVNSASNSVTVLDASPLTRLERVNVGSGPASLVLDPRGARAFVFNSITSSISVIDIPRRSLVATISTDAAPIRGQFNARGDRLFVIHERSPYVTVIDPLQLTIVMRARLRIGVSALGVDARRGLVYIGGRDDTMVEFYDPSTLLPVGSMKTGGGVSYLTIDAEESNLYMVSPDTRTLLIGSLTERVVVSEIDVGESPYWVAVMGER